MKIAYTSDLHVDAGSLGHTAARMLPSLVRIASPDVFIIGGDIASKLSLMDHTLASFGEIPCPKLYVPGNHDIWVSSPKEQEISSRDKYERLIPQVCAKNGFHYLPGNPTIFEGVGFAGSIGWYDYSFRNPALDALIPEQVYRRKHYDGHVWNDRRYAKWGASDPEVAEEMAAALDRDLSALSGRCTRMAAVTHHLPFSRMVRRTGNPTWDYFGAFMGSESLGEAILRHPEVVLVLSGHTHFRLDLTICGIRAVTSPVGYARERPGAPERAVEESLLIVEL